MFGSWERSWILCLCIVVEGVLVGRLEYIEESTVSLTDIDAQISVHARQQMLTVAGFR